MKKWMTENQKKFIIKLWNEKLGLTRSELAFEVINIETPSLILKFNSKGDIMGGLDMEDAKELINDLLNRTQEIKVNRAEGK